MLVTGASEPTEIMQELEIHLMSLSIMVPKFVFAVMTVLGVGA
jgi:hypothetical protein